MNSILVNMSCKTKMVPGLFFVICGGKKLDTDCWLRMITTSFL